MKIFSLVPSSTELLFALGLDGEVGAVTDERDYPAATTLKAEVTKSFIDQGEPSATIDGLVKLDTNQYISR